MVCHALEMITHQLMLIVPAFPSPGRGTGYNKVRTGEDEGECSHACLSKFTFEGTAL